MKKKLLSLALALAVCLSLTVPALAEDWENAKEVKNYKEFIAAVEDEKVEEIKIVGEVTVPATKEPILVETPVLVGTEGKLTMAPEAVMFVHVPMGRFNFEDRENTWDHVAEMCETFIIWHPDEDTYNRDIFGTAQDINEQVKNAGGEPINCLVASGADVNLTDDLSVEGSFQIYGHNLTVGKGVKLEAGSLFVDGDITLEEGASLTLGEEGGTVTGKINAADESQIPEGLEAPEPEAPAAPVNPFTDVAATSAFYDAILWAVDEEITNGTSATTFSPDNTCTIQQILTFLYRANGKPGAQEGVADRDNAIEWAVKQSIIHDAEGMDLPCTRDIAVYYMWKAAGSPEADTSKLAFTDVPADDAELTGAVAWAVEQGITAGTSATTFSPGNTCTRGQIVTFLYRANA